MSDAWCPTLREDGVTPSKAYFHCGVNSSHHPCKLHDYYSDSSWQWNPTGEDLKEKYSCCEDTVNTFVFSTAEVTHSSQTMTVTRQDGMQWTLTRQSDSRGSCKCGFFVASIDHTNPNIGLYVVFERFITLFNLISIMSLFFQCHLCHSNHNKCHSLVSQEKYPKINTRKE